MWPNFKVPKSVKWKFAGKRRRTKHYTKEVWCVCVCGKKRWIPVQNLKQEKSRQCHSCSLVQHGSSRTRLYNIWKIMRQRCLNPNSGNYKYYGARGIKVCKQWDSFSNFQVWALSNNYKDHLTIERINVNGHYRPGNCEWIPPSEQANNTTRNVVVDGKNLSQWAKELNVSRSMLQGRYQRGQTGKQLLRPRRKESSKYPGVSFDPTSKQKPWRARSGKNGKVYGLGRFETERQAYNKVRKFKQDEN